MNKPISQSDDVSVLHAEIEDLQRINTKQSERLNLLEEQLRLLLAGKFKPKTEVVSPHQGHLFADDEAEAPEVATPDEQVTITYKRKQRGKRKKLSEDVERVRVEYALPEAERVCQCGDALCLIGEVTSEQYDIVPMRLRVIEHAQFKYRCNTCKDTIKTAKKTPQPLEKSIASPGLLAHVATAKYVDAMPLARQEKQLARRGIEIPRQTIARWMIASSQLLIPMLNLIEDAIRAGPAIYCDETTRQVLKEPDRRADNRSYVWCLSGGLKGREAVLFHYDVSRSSEVALRLTADYHGYLHCDAFSSYYCLESKGIKLVGCWAHARRKFVDAIKAVAVNDHDQQGRAQTAIAYIKKLYLIEKSVRSADDQTRYEARQKEAVPVLAEYKIWLEAQSLTVTPKSALGKAIYYNLNQWSRLICYCEQGYLEIDNNSSERKIRPYAIGRKNWMFSDTQAGAHANARFYSLIETCKLHGHEPYAYLRYLFKELPKVQSVDEYEALLPWHLEGETLRNLAYGV